MKFQFKRSLSFICVLLVIIAALSLSACGQETKSIVGTWAGSFPIKSNFDQAFANSVVFYEDGSLSVGYDAYNSGGMHYGQDEFYGTYVIIRDGTAIELDPDDSWFRNMTIEYKLVSNDSLVLYINGTEYTMQRDK